MERVEEIGAADVAGVLHWWVDAGVDSLVAESPRNWLQPKPAPAPASAPVPEPEPAEQLPEQLGLFHDWLRTSDSLPYAAPSVPRVCPAGDPASGLMIMAGMPEAADCDAGALLTGSEGRLFDRMLAAIGRDRGSIYLAALSCIRPPAGRLGRDEADRCATLARHHIGLAQPRALLLLGDAPTKALLGLNMVQARGRWHEIDVYGGKARALATFSPTYLLRMPAAKAQAWEDLQLLLEGLGS